MTDYMKYRGKCKQFVEEAVKVDPCLTVVRGHYECPIWGLQPHWWCVRTDGSVFDPTVGQFPSRGLGEYIPFNGMVTCETCGKEVVEDHAYIMGNYACCSYSCARSLVGV